MAFQVASKFVGFLLLKKNSKFSLKDLPKYSKELRGKSALGKNGPQTLKSRLKEIEK